MKRSIKHKIKSFFQPSKITSKADNDKKGFSKVLTRSDDFEAQYNNWKSNGDAALMLKLLRATIEGSTGSEESSPGFDFYNLPGAKGFSVYGLSATDPGNYRFLMDLFKERLLEMDYRLYSSTIEQKTKIDLPHTAERHYLKPAARSTDKPMEQLYGNVLIELEIPDGRVKQLKLLATHYTGYDYRPVRDFDELMVNLLEG